MSFFNFFSPSKQAKQQQQQSFHEQPTTPSTITTGDQNSPQPPLLVQNSISDSQQISLGLEITGSQIEQGDNTMGTTGESNKQQLGNNTPTQSGNEEKSTTTGSITTTYERNNNHTDTATTQTTTTTTTTTTTALQLSDDDELFDNAEPFTTASTCLSSDEFFKRIDELSTKFDVSSNKSKTTNDDTNYQHYHNRFKRVDPKANISPEQLHKLTTMLIDVEEQVALHDSKKIGKITVNKTFYSPSNKKKLDQLLDSIQSINNLSQDNTSLPHVTANVKTQPTPRFAPKNNTTTNTSQQPKQQQPRQDITDPQPTDTLVSDDIILLQQFAKEIGISIDELQKYPIYVDELVLMHQKISNLGEHVTIHANNTKKNGTNPNTDMATINATNRLSMAYNQYESTIKFIKNLVEEQKQQKLKKQQSRERAHKEAQKSKKQVRSEFHNSLPPLQQTPIPPTPHTQRSPQPSPQQPLHPPVTPWQRSKQTAYSYRAKAADRNNYEVKIDEKGNITSSTTTNKHIYTSLYNNNQYNPFLQFAFRVVGEDLQQPYVPFSFAAQKPPQTTLTATNIPNIANNPHHQQLNSIIDSVYNKSNTTTHPETNAVYGVLQSYLFPQQANKQYYHLTTDAYNLVKSIGYLSTKNNYKTDAEWEDLLYTAMGSDPNTKMNKSIRLFGRHVSKQIKTIEKNDSTCKKWFEPNKVNQQQKNPFAHNLCKIMVKFIKYAIKEIYYNQIFIKCVDQDLIDKVAVAKLGDMEEEKIVKKWCNDNDCKTVTIRTGSTTKQHDIKSSNFIKKGTKHAHPNDKINAIIEAKWQKQDSYLLYLRHKQPIAQKIDKRIENRRAQLEKIKQNTNNLSVPTNTHHNNNTNNLTTISSKHSNNNNNNIKNNKYERPQQPQNNQPPQKNKGGFNNH